MILLGLHDDREGAPQPFLAERIRDRALVPNVQLFHRAPPSPHFAGRARKRRNRLISASSAATSSPASGLPDQSFYGLRLPHRRDLSVAQARVGLGQLFVSKTTRPVGAFTLRVICAPVNPTDRLCARTNYLCVPTVVIYPIHSAKSFGTTGVCPSCVISVLSTKIAAPKPKAAAQLRSSTHSCSRKDQRRRSSAKAASCSRQRE
jgi:hypothetical protein